MSADVYAVPDMTKKVRQRGGDRGERRDSEDSGQSEEDRGQMEEMVVDIYQSVDVIRSSDVVSGVQEDMRDEDTGRHTQGELDNTETLHVMKELIVQRQSCASCSRKL